MKQMLQKEFERVYGVSEEEIYKQEFIEFMVECGVLKFGDFVTKSGRKTFYFLSITTITNICTIEFGKRNRSRYAKRNSLISWSK